MRARVTVIQALGVFAATVSFASLAWARAGGGEHYTPGGSSSGDYGGGGDGLPLYLIWWLIRLTFEHPLVALPIWAVVLFIAWSVNRSRPGSATRRAMKRVEYERVRPQSDLHTSLQRLREQDPAFDQAVLTERVRKLFREVQEAWFLRDLTPVRRYLTDATYRRFSTLLTLMHAEGRRDAQADVRILGLRPLRVTLNESFESVTFEIDASMRDTDVAAHRTDEEARREASHAPEQRFTEMWTFLRRRGASSTSDAVWGQGGCPNCGAPFTGGETNTCEYCNAIVNSGNHDWVLSEITQASEYTPHPATDRVLARLRERDPEAAAEILEDRALLLFWKWIEACAFADPSRVRKLTTRPSYDRIAASLRDAPKDRVPLVRIPAVGGADVLACEVDVDGFDRIHVDLRWSAAMGGGSTRPRRHVLVMVRKTGAATNKGVGLSTERCGNCSAPLTDSDSTACAFCGEDLAAAEHQWQLVDLMPRETWSRPSADVARAELPVWSSRSERIRILQLVAGVARADGHVDASERRLLKQLARRWSVPWDDVEPFLYEEPDAVLAMLDDGASERAGAVLRILADAARADGRIDRRERAIIQKTARHLKADPALVEEVLRD